MVQYNQDIGSLFVSFLNMIQIKQIPQIMKKYVQKIEINSLFSLI